MPWLGEFHKLKNLHLCLLKRYKEFHLEEHVRHFLDDPTVTKIKRVLSMKDFDLSNKLFYCDVIAGITEFALSIKQFSQSSRESNPHDPSVSAVHSPNVCTLENIHAFCQNFVHICPELAIVERYLLSEGLAVISFLEVQQRRSGDTEHPLHSTTTHSWTQILRIELETMHHFGGIMNMEERKSYAHNIMSIFFGNTSNISNVHLPNNSRHIIVGGEDNKTIGY